MPLGGGGRLEISYKTIELRDFFRFPAKAFARYGATVARALAVRFADLRALPNAADLVAFSAQDYVFQEDQAMELPITEDCSLILLVAHPKQKNRPLSWANVTRIKIAEIKRRDEQVRV